MNSTNMNLSQINTFIHPASMHTTWINPTLKQTTLMHPKILLKPIENQCINTSSINSSNINTSIIKTYLHHWYFTHLISTIKHLCIQQLYIIQQQYIQLQSVTAQYNNTHTVGYRRQSISGDTQEAICECERQHEIEIDFFTLLVHFHRHIIQISMQKVS